MTTSATGAELDPIDGQPVFTDGMSRRRWLDSTKDQRKAKFIEDLLAPADDEFAIEQELDHEDAINEIKESLDS